MLMSARSTSRHRFAPVWLLGSEASGFEDEGFYFAFVALSGDFFAVQHETYAGGVSGFHYDLARGADGGVRGGDQGFLGDWFAVSDE
jgi:hypothetical protein